METYAVLRENLKKKRGRLDLVVWPFGAGIIFVILAHSVYKMWLIQAKIR